MTFRKVLRRVLLSSLALVPLLAAGCGAREAVNFNNTIANGNKKLNAAGVRFGKAIAPALQGGGVNMAEIEASYKNAVDTLAEVKRDMASATVPDSPVAKKLAEGYQKFLRGQEQAITKDLQDIMQAIKTNQNGRIMPILQTVAQREQADLLELQNLQREFAREYNIKLQAAP